MNILYLQGLDSNLSIEKKEVLEPFGNIIAPDLDYRANPNMIETLYTEYKNQNINFIIGSSMGGFAGFYLSKLLQTPALLFNPALPYRTPILQNIPMINNDYNHLLQIVIGNQDDVILAKDNLDFIMKLLPLKNDFRLHLINELGHGIPVATFESEVNLFFR
ncbi:MAG: YqiA/YcfP family alpha/beta fold hydrolase [Flavobacterium sp.]|uniref:YqiA/YcfP family alpha/beta fold hydrolase n=1 Tax=Flavobacterium sp. TaxID=239 RepID=UPI003262CFF9